MKRRIVELTVATLRRLRGARAVGVAERVVRLESILGDRAMHDLATRTAEVAVTAGWNRKPAVRARIRERSAHESPWQWQ
jgi:hypothetical protein